MNGCMVGNCICGAAEWEGDTYCDAYYGISESYDPLPDRVTGPPAYYVAVSEWTGLPIVFSVDPSERDPSVRYYRDPDLTTPY